MLLTPRGVYSLALGVPDSAQTPDMHWVAAKELK